MNITFAHIIPHGLPGQALLLTILLLICPSLYAHHVLGRPAYSLNEDSNTPPSMQVETQIGKYYVTFMAFPAFPKPNEPGRVNLYASKIENGNPYVGKVTFKARKDSWFSGKDEIIGTQDIDDSVYRQSFQFHSAGNYIISAEFQADNEPYTIEFPLRIGDPAPVGPIGITVGILLLVLLSVNIIQRKRKHRLVAQQTRENNRP